MTEAIPKRYAPPPDLLAGRVILVTGAGDGIGRAASISFASHGATVILLGRTVAKLESTYDIIVNAGGPQPAIYPMDLLGASPGHHEEMAQRLDAEFGHLDGLLHNASLLGMMTPVENYDPETWAQVMQVNVNAPFLMTRACLPVLRKSQDASILFTSSTVGRHGRAYWGAYAVSKFATEGLMQVLADELDNVPNMRVNSINPGAVRTGMRARAYPAEDPATRPEPAAIMGAYLYLMGPDSRGVSRQTLDAQ